MKTLLIVSILFSLILFSKVNSENTEPISNQQEYQVILYSSDWSNESKRTDMINNFLQIAENNIGVSVSQFTQTTSLRIEGKYSLGNCDQNGDSGMIRQRFWEAMDLAGQISVDLKIAPVGMSRTEAFQDTYASPATEYESQAQQDVEQDIHYCEGKDWSRTTKIFFDETSLPSLQTCGDLRSLFPDYFDSKTDNKEVSFKYGSSVTYYIEYNYVFPDDNTKLRMQFDLQYSNENDATNGNDCTGGEFSITFSGPDYGYEWPFNYEKETLIRKAYDEIVQTYGSNGEDNCNSSQFSTLINSSEVWITSDAPTSTLISQFLLVLSCVLIFF